jgi:hypothetical protein
LKQHPNKATDYKLVLQQPSLSSSSSSLSEEIETTTYCDVRAVIDHVRGPVGMARLLRRMTRVLLVGDSFLHQIIEAMACGWHWDLMNNSFQVGGPVFNHDSSQWVLDTMTPNRVGILTTLNPPKDGCHAMQKATDNLAKYYFPSVQVPDSILGCDDNAVFLEFGKVLQMYMSFGPLRRTPQSSPTF